MVGNTLSQQVNPLFLQRSERLKQKYVAQEEAKRRFAELQSEANRIRAERFTDTPERPLTFEVYKEEYSKLSPDLQQFFASPDEIIAGQEAKKKADKDLLQSRIDEKSKYYEAKQKEQRDWEERNAGKVRQDEYRRVTREYDLDIQEAGDELRYLQEGMGKLEAGYDVYSIMDYAENKAIYNRERSERKQKAYLEFKEELKKGNLDSTLKALKLDKSTITLEKYQQAIESYNSSLPRLEAQRKKAIEEFQKANPTEKLVFDKTGNLVSIQSGKFGETFSVERYNQKLQQNPYEEWKNKIDQAPIYLDFKEVKTQLPYMSRGTIGASRTEFTPIAIQPENQKPSTFQKIAEFGAKILSKTPELKVGLFGGMGSVPVREVTEPLKSSLKEQKQEIYEKDIEESGIKAKLEPKFQQEYQVRFERKYYPKIYSGETTFEEAKKEFESSDEAKIINKKYQEAVEKERAGKFTKAGFKVAGLTLGEQALKLVPETSGELAVEGLVLYGIYNIPAKASYVLTGVIGAKGTVEALSPVASPEEKAMGLFEAGVSVGALGYAGYRYLRTPTIRGEPIIVKEKIPQNLKKSFVVPKERVVVIDQYGNTVTKEYYEAFKLHEQVIAGRRTIVSTKFRDMFGMKPVYQGIPTAQAKKIIEGEDVFSGEKYVLSEEPSGYQKALKLLTKRGGLTVSQAKITLRNYQAREIAGITEANVVVTYGKGKPTYEVTGTREIYQPVEIIDKELGIKTRGAMTRRDYLSGSGTIGETKKGIQLQEAWYDIERRFLTPSGREFNLVSQAGKTTEGYMQLSGVWDKGEGTLNLNYKEFKFRKFGEASATKRIIPRGKTYGSQGEGVVFEKNVPETTYDLREVLRQEYGITMKQDIVKPKAVRTLKGESLATTLRRIYGTESPKTIPATSGNVMTETMKPETVVRRTQITKPKLITLPTLPDIKVTIRNMMKSFSDSASSINSAVASITALETGQETRGTTKVRTDVDEMLLNKQAELLSQNLQQKSRERLAQKTTQSASEQFDLTAPAISIPNIEIPDLDIPNFPTPKTPVTPLPALQRAKKKRLEKKLKEKKMSEFGLLPDFTSRAIGLEAEEIDMKDINKALKQIQTGFEIRKGGKIKKR